MADNEETPAQKQARIRRQKREAKINANAQDRLDKITQLSGRTPESMRNQTPLSTPGAATPPNAAASPNSPSSLPSMPPPNAGPTDPEQARLQEEYLRAMLRGSGPQSNGQGQGQGGPGEDDPMMKMLNTMMAGMGGEGADPNNPGGMPFNPDDLAKQLPLPPWATNMLFGSQQAPPTPAEQRSLRMWRIVHVVVAVLSGLFMVFTISASTQTYGADPPAPATFQNPFVVFLMAELLLQSTRILTTGQAGKRGPALWFQMLKELAGDGAIIVFMLGLATWWKGNL